MVRQPGEDLVHVHVHGILFEIDPGFELMQTLFVVVFTHPRVVTIVPIMYTADEIVPDDSPVSHQGAAMLTAAVKHRYLIVIANHNQVDIGDKSIPRLTIFQLTPGGGASLFYCLWLHRGHFASPSMLSLETVHFPIFDIRIYLDSVTSQFLEFAL